MDIPFVWQAEKLHFQFRMQKKKTLKHVDDVTDKSKSLKYRAA